MAYIKLNKNNLFYNLKELSLKTGNKKKLAAVLKDNAYGHGLVEIANLVSNYGLEEAVVISNEEALKIRELFKNILILNDTPKNISNFSYSITDISKLKTISKNIKIELKVDTGMHRNGIVMKELNKALDIIKQKKLNLIGVFTHFRSADEFSSEFAWQKDNFKEVKKLVKNRGFKVRFHSYNSAALLRSNSFDEDIARIGIAMYGYNELAKIINNTKLKPVLSLWAKRVSTRELLKGEKVGYGGDFVASKNMLISTYDIGYGDGLFRGDSKNPLIIQDNLKILGRVSMDFISLESIEDEICIFNDANRVAKHFNTISYEILSSLKSYLKRKIL